MNFVYIVIIESEGYELNSVWKNRKKALERIKELKKEFKRLDQKWYVYVKNEWNQV